MPDSSKAVFLSYASQDAEAARRICETLRAAGVEVWFDADGGLEHGDEWDAKIRRQIKECVLFIPIISANTQARHEGYFRIEWELAAQRGMGIASGVAFILPVVIDDTREPDALVPDRFRTVQWTRLRDGLITPEVSARFLKLWSHRMGVNSAAARNPGALSPAANSAGLAPTPGRKKQSRYWTSAVIAGVGLVLAFAIWWRTPERAGARKGPAPVMAVASEARALALQVQDILIKPELGMSELDAAAMLCARAESLDSSDAVVWATASEVDTAKYYFGGERTPERRESARLKAARALNLSPQGFEARRAEASYLVQVVNTAQILAQAEPALRELRRERPHDRQTLLLLGLLFRDIHKLDEAYAFFDELALQPAAAATAFNEKGWALLLSAQRYEDAEIAANHSLAAQPFSGNVVLKVHLALIWEGDLDLALATLKKLPAAALFEDRNLAAAIRIHRWRRAPQDMLDLLGSVSREWITWGIDGPKEAIMGDAQELLGRPSAARNNWRKALAIVEQRLVSAPSDRSLVVWKAYLLAALAEKAAAEDARNLAREVLADRPPLERLGVAPSRAMGYNFVPRLATPDEVVTAIEAELQDPRTGLTVAQLRLNPSLDSVRSLPRFQTILAQAVADGRFAPKAISSGRVTATHTTASEKSIAVLAFKNLSDDKDSGYFSDGISEELSNVLARVPGLKVCPRTSAFYFKDKDVAIAEIARQLNVAYIVEGSVRKYGTRVRITAKLIKAADGFPLWSSPNLDREVKDVLAVQDEIAGLIAQNLQLSLGSPARTTQTVNPEAYGLVLQGWHFFALRPQGLAEAETAFARAVALDPRFAPAHAGLVDAFSLRGLWLLADGRGPVDQDFSEAAAAARRALELDPTLVEPHTALGVMHMMDRRLVEAETDFAAAFRLNPNYGTTYHWHSLALALEGRFDRALAELERAVSLDPLASTAQFSYGSFLFAAGRIREGLDALDRSIEIKNTFLTCHGIRAVALLELGRTEEAMAAARAVRDNPEHSWRWWADGDAVYVLKRGGAVREAEDYVRKLRASLPAKSHLLGYALCALGNFDEGLPLLETIEPMCQTRLYFMPMFEPLQNTPRFQQLFAKLNSVEEYRVARETLARLRPTR